MPPLTEREAAPEVIRAVWRAIQSLLGLTIGKHVVGCVWLGVQQVIWLWMESHWVWFRGICIEPWWAFDAFGVHAACGKPGAVHEISHRQTPQPPDGRSGGPDVTRP